MSSKFAIKTSQMVLTGAHELQIVGMKKPGLVALKPMDAAGNRITCDLRLTADSPFAGKCAIYARDAAYDRRSPFGVSVYVEPGRGAPFEAYCLKLGPPLGGYASASSFPLPWSDEINNQARFSYEIVVKVQSVAEGVKYWACEWLEAWGFERWAMIRNGANLGIILVDADGNQQVLVPGTSVGLEVGDVVAFRFSYDSIGKTNGHCLYELAVDGAVVLSGSDGLLLPTVADEQYQAPVSLGSKVRMAVNEYEEGPYWQAGCDNGLIIYSSRFYGGSYLGGAYTPPTDNLIFAAAATFRGYFDFGAQPDWSTLVLTTGPGTSASGVGYRYEISASATPPTFSGDYQTLAAMNDDINEETAEGGYLHIEFQHVSDGLTKVFEDELDAEVSLSDEVVMPEQTAIDSWTRTLDAGSCVITGGLASQVNEVWGGFNLVVGSAEFNLGERTGPGTCDLDFSAAYNDSLTPGVDCPFPLMLRVKPKNAQGFYGPDSDPVGEVMIGDGEPFVISRIRRNAAGDKVKFKLTGLEDDYRLWVLWVGADEVGLAAFAVNGELELPPSNQSALDPAKDYAFTAVGQLPDGRWNFFGAINFKSPRKFQAAGDANALLLAIQAALEADEALAVYNEIVSIGAFDLANLPEFEAWGIVITANDDQRITEEISLGLKQDTVVVTITALVWAFNNADAQTGDPDLDAEQTVGIQRMGQDIFNVINRNSFGGIIDLAGDELAREVPVKLVADGYYYSATLTLKARLAPYIG